MYHRILKPLYSNSFFLFGPRGVGKTSLLKALFAEKNCYWVNLLDPAVYRTFLLHPETLEQRIPKKTEWVIIDEVQKIPGLLDLVHKLIEEKKIKFALTGSSARKLKRGGANLLAGRAFLNNLHPLTVAELKDDFDLNQVLQWGSLPRILSLDMEIEKREFLNTYVNTFLKEEIREEQIVRKMEPFIKFLEVAAQANGKQINESKIARDSGVDAKAAQRYFEILVDTLLGFFLEPYHASVRKRQSQRSKFYFFDIGICRALANSLGLDVRPGTYTYGEQFEHFLILELLRMKDYHRKDYRFSYLCTKDDLEIDVIIERPGKPKVLLEIKSAERVDDTEIRRLEGLKNDLKPCVFWVASREKESRSLGFAEILPWQEVLARLYGSSP